METTPNDKEHNQTQTHWRKILVYISWDGISCERIYTLELAWNEFKIWKSYFVSILEHVWTNWTLVHRIFLHSIIRGFSQLKYVSIVNYF